MYLRTRKLPPGGRTRRNSATFLGSFRRTWFVAEAIFYGGFQGMWSVADGCEQATGLIGGNADDLESGKTKDGGN